MPYNEGAGKSFYGLMQPKLEGKYVLLKLAGSAKDNWLFSKAEGDA